MKVLTLFDLWSNLGLIKGILVFLAKKRHFGCSGARTGYAMSFWPFSQLHREKIIFLDFSGSGTQIEGKQNTISIATPFLSDILSAMRGVK